MQWFYLDPNKQQVPFDEIYLEGLVNDGRVNAQTLIWSQSMENWTPAGQVHPQLFGSAPQQQSIQTTPAHNPQQHQVTEPTAAPKKLNEDMRETVRDLASYISVNAGWIKFFGVMMIIAGIPAVFFIYGGFMIWLGVILMRAADEAKVAEQTGVQQNLENSIYNISKYFKVNGILMLIMIIVQVVGIILMFVFWGAIAAMAIGAGAAGEAMPDQL